MIKQLIFTVNSLVALSYGQLNRLYKATGKVDLEGVTTPIVDNTAFG